MVKPNWTLVPMDIDGDSGMYLSARWISRIAGAAASARLRPQQITREMITKGLVYQGPGKKALDQRPMPEIQSTGDAIVKSSRRRSAAPICIFSGATFRLA